MTKVNKELTLTRIFNAPRELVFDAWLDPVQLAKWWGPEGFTNQVYELDTKQGGNIRLDMIGPDGTAFPMGGTFHEITPPEKIIFTSTAFEDEQGNAQLEVLNTVIFTALNNNKTELKLHAVVQKATPEMDAPLSGMEAGWSGSLDKLGVLVAQ